MAFSRWKWVSLPFLEKGNTRNKEITRWNIIIPGRGFGTHALFSEGSFVLMTENQLKMFLAKRHLLAQVPERSWEQLPAGLCLFPFLPSVFLCYLPFESGSLWGLVCSLAPAAITKYHGLLSNSRNFFPTILEATSPRSGLVPSGD